MKNFAFYDTTKDTDIHRQVQEFSNFKSGQELDLKSKLFSITIDGAPDTRGKNVGFLKLIENELGHSLSPYHT